MEHDHAGSWCGVAIECDRHETRLWLLPMSEVLPQTPTLFHAYALEANEAALQLGGFILRAIGMSDWAEFNELRCPSDTPEILRRSIRTIDLDPAPSSLADLLAAPVATFSVLQFSAPDWQPASQHWDYLSSWIARGLADSFPLIAPPAPCGIGIGNLNNPQSKEKFLRQALGSAQAWREAHDISSALASHPRHPPTPIACPKPKSL